MPDQPKNNSSARVMHLPQPDRRRRTDAPQPPGVFPTAPLEEAPGPVARSVASIRKAVVTPYSAIQGALYPQAQTTSAIISALGRLQAPMSTYVPLGIFLSNFRNPQQVASYIKKGDTLAFHTAVRFAPEGKMQIRRTGPSLGKQDVLVKMALEGNTVFVEGNKLFTAGPEGEVSKEKMFNEIEGARILIPIGELGIIVVSGQNLRLNALVSPRSAVVECARDFGYLFSMHARSTTDSLTGLASRGVYNQLMKHQLGVFTQGGPDASVVMMDLDHFKSVNDSYGHAAGDQVLVECAARMANTLRSTDLVTHGRGSPLGAAETSRFGGEEFVVLLSGTDTAGGIIAALRVRQAISSAPIFAPGGQTIPQTASFGVSSFGDAKTALEWEHILDLKEASASSELLPPSRTLLIPDDIKERGALDELVQVLADGALYMAKDGGRNIVVAPHFAPGMDHLFSFRAYDRLAD